MLKQNLEMQISTMKKRMSEATTEKSGLEDAKATAEEELSSTKKTLADDEKYTAAPCFFLFYDFYSVHRRKFHQISMIVQDR